MEPCLGASLRHKGRPGCAHHHEPLRWAGPVFCPTVDTLEELARRALSLGWFDPTGAGFNWHHFGGTKVSNAEAIRQTSASNGDGKPGASSGSRRPLAPT